ncbi:MAG: FGGY family carbohydrate kinase [Promethearchaeia archaeon]
MLNDWITYTLTGEFFSDFTSAPESQIFDIKKLNWSSEIIEAFCLNSDWFPEIIESKTIAGNLKQDITKELGLNSKEIPYVGGEIMVAEYAEAGSEELAENVIKQLGDKNAVLLANHGNLCCGSHLEGAYTVLTYMERAVKIYYMAKIIGNPSLLPKDTIDYEKDIYELFKEDGKI